MKKYVSFFVLFVFFSGIYFSLSAQQKIKIGVKAGTSFPSLRSNSDNEISTGYESKMAEDFGLVADFGISETFSIKTGIDYTGQGGIRNGQQPVTNIPDELAPLLQGMNYIYAKFNNNSVLNYMEIPLMGKLEWGNKLRYYLNAGPYLGLLLNAKQKTSGSSPLYLDKAGTIPVTQSQPFNATTDVKDDLNSTNIGLTGGVGVSYNLNKKSSLLFDARAAYGLKSIQKDVETNGNSKTGGIFLTLGYMFFLK